MQQPSQVDPRLEVFAVGVQGGEVTRSRGIHVRVFERQGGFKMLRSLTTPAICRLATLESRDAGGLFVSTVSGRAYCPVVDSRSRDPSRATTSLP
jgi:hypothetical protein